MSLGEDGRVTTTERGDSVDPFDDLDAFLCQGADVGPFGARGGRIAGWLSLLWLVFMVPAFLDGWHQRGELSGMVAMVATGAFMCVYAVPLIGHHNRRRRMLLRPQLRVGLPYVGALLALGITITIAIGPNGTAAAVYVAVGAMMTLPLIITIPLDVVVVATVLLVGHLRDWPGLGGVALGTILGSLAIFAMRGMMARNVQLLRAHQENTSLAVAGERNRFARDLHDILGHSLTVITVKAELAQRLCDIDRERARQELADLERLSRDALSDVRRAVEGYRELTLPGELARARTALQSAEIVPALPQSTDEVPSELRELFAWTVREGVTNVIRHSRAQRCEITLTGDRAIVSDNGLGPTTDSGDGTGLTGLRERAAAVGAVVTTRRLSPGFSLEVSRP